MNVPHDVRGHFATLILVKLPAQWNGNQRASHTDRLDSAVESVQSDVEWEQGIRISRIWAWQNSNAALAWQHSQVLTSGRVDLVSHCFSFRSKPI